MYDHEYDHIIERRQRRDNERINLNTIKQAIDRKLATPQKSRLYWNSLTLFLKTKLSKFEWDHIVKVLLGPDFGMFLHFKSFLTFCIVPLHNYFIRSLFFNARSTSSIPLKEPTKPIDHVLYKKSEKKKDLILRNRIIDTSNLEPISMDPYSFPDQNILSARMNRIAMDAGLLVSNDCVTLVQRALATHLKNILAKMIRMKVGNINEELVELRRTSPEVGSFLMGKSPFNVPDVVHRYEIHFFYSINFEVMYIIWMTFPTCAIQMLVVFHMTRKKKKKM